LFDTLNDETNWSQISGALDGSQMMRVPNGSLCSLFFLDLGHKKWATLLALIGVKKSD
jgi:hypothetical protein